MKISEKLYWDGTQYLVEIRYRDHKLEVIRFYNSEGMLHRNNGPAEIKYECKFLDKRKATKLIYKIGDEGYDIEDINDLMYNRELIHEAYYIDGKYHKTEAGDINIILNVISDSGYNYFGVLDISLSINARTELYGRQILDIENLLADYRNIHILLSGIIVKKIYNE